MMDVSADHGINGEPVALNSAGFRRAVRRIVYYTAAGGESMVQATAAVVGMNANERIGN